ncbi:MAG: hypothetical protein RLZZ301_817 [Bacteroidota bacterium]|jgi:hypothetical protein
MKLESRKQHVATRSQFALRILRYFLFSSFLIAFSLGLGTFGYRYFTGASWVDCFHMASMILTGMGPVIPIDSDGAKLFSSFYALYSGVAFLTCTAVFFSPIIHRLLHILHVDDDDAAL